MQLFADPNHWATGVNMFKNSSVLGPTAPPKLHIEKQSENVMLYVEQFVYYILRF